MERIFSIQLPVKSFKFALYRRKHFIIYFKMPVPGIFIITGETIKIPVISRLAQLNQVIQVGPVLLVLNKAFFGKGFEQLEEHQSHSQAEVTGADGFIDLFCVTNLENIFTEYLIFLLCNYHRPPAEYAGI